MTKSKYVLALDPSINTCGLAIYKDNNLGKYLLIEPINITNTKRLFGFKTNESEYIPKGIAQFNQICKIRQILIDEVTVENVTTVIEVPEHWGVSGYAARESGSIMKLMFLCGMVNTLQNVVCVTPSGWKGQIPKHVMKNRFEKDFPNVDFNKIRHDVMDAIGIGSWYCKLNK